MQAAFRALLLSDPTLVGLVGRRITWDVADQGKGPKAVVLYLISDVPDYHMQGPSALTQSRVQIDCRGKDKPEVVALAAAVQALLSGYKGVCEGVHFEGVFKTLGRSSFVRTEAEGFYLESADYEFWWAAAA